MSVSGKMEGSAEGISLFAIRFVVGAFLVWGVWDNIVSAERMEEFERFLAANAFPLPAIMAPVSVWAQFAVGLSFAFGLLVRAAGLVCAVNFVVAVVMVDAHLGVRAAFPSMLLTLLGIHFAVVGGGPISFDWCLRPRLLRFGGNKIRV